MAHEARKDTAQARRAGTTPPRATPAQRARPLQVGGAPKPPNGSRAADDPFKDLPAPKPLSLMHQFYLQLHGGKAP